MKKISFLLTAMSIALTANPARAAYVVNILQSGADVVATGSGSLNTTGLTLRTSYTLPLYMTPAGGNFLTGSSGAYSVFQTVTPALPFGAGGTQFILSSVGSPVGILSNQYLLTPQNYVSGSDLGTTITTFANATFATLGLTAGSYVWTWGSGVTADSFTLNIGPVAAAVPEPATWAMMILGFGLVGAGLRRRAQQQPRIIHHAA